MLYNNSVFCNILSGKVTILINLTNLMINWLAFQLFWNTVSLKEEIVEIYYKVFFYNFSLQPNFPNMILQPGQTYTQTTSYKFGF